MCSDNKAVEAKCGTLPFNGVQITTRWIIPEDRGIVWEGRQNIIMHPYTLCSFLAYNGMYFEALDKLHKYFYEMIDNKFS